MEFNLFIHALTFRSLMLGYGWLITSYKIWGCDCLSMLRINSRVTYVVGRPEVIEWLEFRARCGPLNRYVKLRVVHARKFRERFPRHRPQKKPLVSDPGMHHGTFVMYVPWGMSGSLTRGGGENVPGIPGACATRNFAHLVRGPWCDSVTIQPTFAKILLIDTT